MIAFKNQLQAADQATELLALITPGEWSFTGDILNSYVDDRMKILGFVQDINGNKEFIISAPKVIADLIDENKRMYHATYSQETIVERNSFEFQLRLVESQLAAANHRLRENHMALSGIVSLLDGAMYDLHRPNVAEFAHEVFEHISHLN